MDEHEDTGVIEQRDVEQSAPVPQRLSWVPPRTEDHEVTPEAAMYSGRRSA